MVIDAGGELLDGGGVGLVERLRQVNHRLVGLLPGDETTHFGEALVQPPVTDPQLLKDTVDRIEQVPGRRSVGGDGNRGHPKDKGSGQGHGQRPARWRSPGMPLRRPSPTRSDHRMFSGDRGSPGYHGFSGGLGILERTHLIEEAGQRGEPGIIGSLTRQQSLDVPIEEAQSHIPVAVCSVAHSDTRPSSISARTVSRARRCRDLTAPTVLPVTLAVCSSERSPMTLRARTSR